MILKLSRIKIAFCLLLVLSAAFALSSCGGGGSNPNESQEGALSVEFDTTLYDVGDKQALPPENQLSFAKYMQIVTDSETDYVADMAYPESDDSVSAVGIYKFNIPFVLKVDGSPADEVISVITLTPPPHFADDIDITSSYTSYFTLSSDGGICNIVASAPDVFRLKVTVESTANGKQATFYFLYDKTF